MPRGEIRALVCANCQASPPIAAMMGLEFSDTFASFASFDAPSFFIASSHTGLISHCCG
jgi:hypothetical protein